MATVLQPIVNELNTVLVQLRTELRGLQTDADGAGIAIKFTPPSKASAPLHTTRTIYGLAAMYDFGHTDHDLGVSWLWRRAGSANSAAIRLKPGMRGRHVFGASSQSAARCFEWKVVQDKINRGLPKFLTSEFLLNEKTGFRERCTQIHAANPNQLWNKLFVEVLGLSAPKSGGELCGFHDEPLARKMHMHHRGGMPEINSKKEFQALSDRWKRFIRSHLGEAFEGVMAKLCPHDPALAFHCLLDSVQWQSRWLPENSLDLIL